jgi:carboxyl-terminal processing protease
VGTKTQYVLIAAALLVQLNAQAQVLEALEYKADLDLKVEAVEKPSPTMMADFGPTADVRPMNEYWSETGMRFPELRTLVNDQNCERNSQEFLACIAGLNSLAREITPQTRFLPSSLSTARRASPSQGRPVTSGAFELAEIPEATAASTPAEQTQMSPSAQWRQIQSRMRTEQSATTAAFTARGASAVDFSAFLETLRTRAITPQNEPHASANAYNAVLSVQTDPHTYLIPTQYEDDSANTPVSTFTGVGVFITQVPNGVRITNVVESGPAHQAGVFTGDILLQVGSRSLEGMTVSQAIELIKGPAGTSVELTLLRRDTTYTVTVVRRAISQPNVTGKLLDVDGTKIGYIKLQTFRELTACDRIASYIQNLHQLNARGLILDLRGNGGGFTAQAQCIAGLFLGRGQLVYSQRSTTTGRVETYLTDRNQQTQLPLMLMIDAGSASASELLAGALQDHKRAYVVGQRSFGKATVQMAFPSHVRGVTLRQTVARFFRPNGGTNQVVGISPDFELPPVPNPTEDDLFATREGDLYTNALPPVGPAWVQPRPEEITRILASCQGHEPRSVARYEQAQQGPLAPDYQLIRATDLMGCIAGGSSRLARR